jgi:tetratricopeptide (TPR) repeat protein
MKGNDPKIANQTSPSVASSPSATNQLTAKELFEQADKKSSGGDKQGAIADYTKASELDPHYTQSVYNRGNARFDLQDKQGAIADFNQAIELDPKFADAYYNRGNAHASLDNRSEAIRDFQKAADLYLKEGKTKGYQDALDRLKKLQQH